jgi:signal transduction histidine kinase
MDEGTIPVRFPVITVDVPEDRLAEENRAAMEDAVANALVCDAETWAEMLARVGVQIYQPSQPPRSGKAEYTAGGGVLGALERERSRIARELHAGAGQPLAAIKLNLDLLGGWSSSMPEPARNAVSRLRDLSDAALEQIRAVSHRLCPPEWQELTTEQAIRHLVDQSGVADSVRMTINIVRLPVEPGHAAKVALYRCAQECISNVIRHSHASQVEISLRSEAELVELRVADNGRGIEPASANAGMGLHAIREHIALLGGTYRISSDLNGTTITVSLRLAED